MKNQYMFFSQQDFENFDLADYRKTDTTIPKTSIHIYTFECIDSDAYSDDKAKAKKLDELTQKLTSTYPDMFQLINSGSSQFFCKEIYPYVVDFETKLRHVLYVARALFENKNTGSSLNKQSFLYTVDKKQQSIEEIDFGKIYECIFTDQDVQTKIKELNTRKMTKGDWKKRIDEIEENTIWHNIVGSSHDFIEKHFLEIIDYRNDVMHNHLISFTQYEKAISTLTKANQELDLTISDILLANKSQYLNKVNIVEAITPFLKTLGIAAVALQGAHLAKALQVVATYLKASDEPVQDSADIDSNATEADSNEEENN